MTIKTEDYKILCDLVFRLTYLRWKGCKHLAIENFAPELMRVLLNVYGESEYWVNQVRQDRSKDGPERDTTA